MDWLYPIYLPYVEREFSRKGGVSRGESVPEAFMNTLADSTATLFVMEPIGDTIRFRGLGKWALSEVPALLTDPNAFIADQFGGGKYKINFHHFETFVGTHNFRTWGEETWRDLEEVFFE